MSGLWQAFVEGMLNPVVVPAHALALVALGLFVGRQSGRGVTLLIFAAALIGGLIALTFAIEPTAARIVLLADAAIVGVLVATAWASPRPVSWSLVAIAGAAIALDSPPQALTIAEGNATLAGTALGACAALLVVSAVAGYASGPWAQLGARILGSWIAASAILVLAVLLK